MPKFNLMYNYEQWADLMETLGKMRPPKGGIQGWNIATTVELDGADEVIESEPIICDCAHSASKVCKFN